MQIRLDPSWKRELADEFTQPYFAELRSFVRDAYATRTIYPPPREIFHALDACPFDKVEVVILGQDPYHGPKQANGLSFSVQEGLRTPPSLQNIFKEIERDIGINTERGGDLDRWAKQGVLLLNATLTVEAGKPGSHQQQGWEPFTDAIVKALSDKREHLVFLLWGAYAQRKGEMIDRAKHLVLTAAHPSPFSVERGFFGCRHFSKANAYLKTHGKKEIDWR
ncbi:MAG: uracil-DNA glycosylase [Candidatus Uhrbacteria bacterium]|nr:uracil-DNA glycosylase [Candidatus Uhrbacteria bacterium]